MRITARTSLMSPAATVKTLKELHEQNLIAGKTSGMVLDGRQQLTT